MCVSVCVCVCMCVSIDALNVCVCVCYVHVHVGSYHRGIVLYTLVCNVSNRVKSIVYKAFEA